FHPHLVACPQGHTDHDVDGVLGARGDDNLVRLASHRSRYAQILAYRRPQLEETAWVGIPQMARTEGAQRAVGELAPGLHRPPIDQRAPHVERPVVAADGRFRKLTEASPARSSPRHSRRESLRRSLWSAVDGFRQI